MVKKSPKYSIFFIQTWISQKLLIWLAPKLACFYFIRRPYFTLNFELQAQYGGPLRRPLFWWKISPKKKPNFFWAKIPKNEASIQIAVLALLNTHLVNVCAKAGENRPSSLEDMASQSCLLRMRSLRHAIFLGFFQYILVSKDQLWVLVFSSAQTLNHPSIPQL